MRCPLRWLGVSRWSRGHASTRWYLRCRYFVNRSLPDHLLSAVVAGYAIAADVGRQARARIPTSNGDVRILLVPANPDVDRPSSIVYFRVADIGAAHAELTTRGAHFDDEPHLTAQMLDHDLWMAFFAT